MYSLQWFIYKGLQLNKQGVYNKYSTIFLKKNNYNTLILGSSRAEMHMDACLFDSLTGLNTFNAGVSGASTRIAFIVLKSYLLHSEKPKNIFLELDFHSCHKKTDKVFNFQRYFCYLSNPVLYSEFRKIDSRFTQFKYNPFYSLPFSGINSLSPALHGWLEKSATYDFVYEKGFFKNTVLDNYDHFDAKQFTGFIHPETRQYLDSFMLFANKNRCRLVFTISPLYKNAETKMLNRIQIINEFQNIAKTNHVDFINLSSDTTVSNHPYFFEDNYHMLYLGARIYTRKIATFYDNISHQTTIK
jgi:hypothetical protein